MSILYRCLTGFASLLLLGVSPTVDAGFEVQDVQLFGESGVVTLDYFAWDSATQHLWIPAGNKASVVLIDAGGKNAGTIGDFKTAEFVLGTRRGRLGPSSVALGNGVAYIGNRADSSICIIDAVTLKRGACREIAQPAQGWGAAPDAVVYVRATKELWVTRGAPPIGIPSSDKSITIFDASDPRTLKSKGKIALGASAEGYVVDNARGAFYTNLEETGETVAIDVHRRTILSRCKSGCDDARGLAIDSRRGFLFVACSSRVIAIDLNHGNKVVSSIDTGDGLDNIDYSETDHLLYAAASNAATLTVARVGEAGDFSNVEVIPTTIGARGVVAGDRGRAYVADPIRGRILIVTQIDRPR